MANGTGGSESMWQWIATGALTALTSALGLLHLGSSGRAGRIETAVDAANKRLDSLPCAKHAERLAGMERELAGVNAWLERLSDGQEKALDLLRGLNGRK